MVLSPDKLCLSSGILYYGIQHLQMKDKAILFAVLKTRNSFVLVLSFQKVPLDQVQPSRNTTALK